MPHLPRQANFHQRKQTRNRGADSVEKAAIQKIFFANLSCPSQSLREKTVPLSQKLGIRYFDLLKINFYFLILSNRSNSYTPIGSPPIIDRKSTRLNSSHVS